MLDHDLHKPLVTPACVCVYVSLCICVCVQALQQLVADLQGLMADLQRETEKLLKPSGPTTATHCSRSAPSPAAAAAPAAAAPAAAAAVHAHNAAEPPADAAADAAAGEAAASEANGAAGTAAADVNEGTEDRQRALACAACAPSVQEERVTRAAVVAGEAGPGSAAVDDAECKVRVCSAVAGCTAYRALCQGAAAYVLYYELVLYYDGCLFRPCASTNFFVMHCVACLSHLPAPNSQMLRAIALFLGRSDNCTGWTLHKALMAGQRSSCASGRWSRLGERCTHTPPAHNLRVPRCACFCAQAARLSAQCVCVCIDVPVAGAGAGGVLRGRKTARATCVLA